jgi:putative redox protein
MSETTEVRVELLDGMAFRGLDQHGLQIVMDATADVGGQGRGPKPVDALAMALGGCTGMDVISILRKMRQDVTAYEVRVNGPRAQTHPKVFTALTVEHVVSGNDLDERQVRRAVTLSATRYCPASAMLGKAVPIRHVYRVLTATGAEVARGESDERVLVG